MKSSHYLKQARKLIADPKHWTKEFYARDGAGMSVDPTAPNATCFCMIGAARKVTGNDLTISDNKLISTTHYLYLAIMPFNHLYVSKFNDDALRTHAEVMAVFDTAIEFAESNGD